MIKVFNQNVVENCIKIIKRKEIHIVKVKCSIMGGEIKIIDVEPKDVKSEVIKITNSISFSEEEIEKIITIVFFDEVYELEINNVKIEISDEEIIKFKNEIKNNMKIIKNN